MDKKTDIWFRTSLSLVDIGKKLKLENVQYDIEDDYDRLLGQYKEYSLFIVRSTEIEPEKIDTKIVLWEAGEPEFPKHLFLYINKRLKKHVKSPILLGKWKPKKNSITYGKEP